MLQQASWALNDKISNYPLISMYIFYSWHHFSKQLIRFHVVAVRAANTKHCSPSPSKRGPDTQNAIRPQANCDQMLMFLFSSADECWGWNVCPNVSVDAPADARRSEVMWTQGAMATTLLQCQTNRQIMETTPVRLFAVIIGAAENPRSQWTAFCGDFFWGGCSF